MPAVYAQSAPSRNEDFAPAMICWEYCGYCCAMSAALENDLVSSFCTLVVTCCPFGADVIATPTAVAYPAVSSAPKIDCMIAPPRSRWRSAVPDAIPARWTGTDPVRECEAGVPARPTPMPMKA